MKKTLKTILGTIILLMGFYSVVTLVQIIFGATETKLSEIALPLIIVAAYFVYMIRNRMKDSNSEILNLKDGQQTISKPSATPTSNEVSRYIITASERVCSYLANGLKDHPMVISTYENTGNWYTNGETGPEWFTVTIEAKWKNKEAIENLVFIKLKEMGDTTSNQFWG